jgi:hypothetical protein
MENRELTVYLSHQDSNNNTNVKQFISEVENRFLEESIVSQPNMESANRPLENSYYFSFRNEMSIDRGYLSAAKAVEEARSRHTNSYNPYGYEDVFTLEVFDPVIWARAQSVIMQAMSMPTPRASGQPIVHQYQATQQEPQQSQVTSDKNLQSTQHILKPGQ